MLTRLRSCLQQAVVTGHVGSGGRLLTSTLSSFSILRSQVTYSVKKSLTSRNISNYCVFQMVKQQLDLGASCISIRSLLSRFGNPPHFHLQRKGHATRVRFDANKNLPRDVLVYSHNNDTFYRALSYFGAFQMLMWSYVSVFSFQHLKSLPVEVKDTTGLPWWKKFLYKEGQYKNALSIIAMIVGVGVLFITLTYPRRAVKNLWLLKGGDSVKITTYSWLGKTNTFKKPVEHLSCTEGRTGKGNYVPLKIKDKNFYFLFDKQGTFHNLELFDTVVGLQRKL